MLRRALGVLALPVAAATLFAAEPVRKQVPTIFAGGVVNAAGFVPAPDNFVAPLAIVSIFGDGLSLATATAGLDENGQLPLTMAGVRVSISGVLMPLFFVSPGQINAQISGRIAPRERAWEIRVTREGLSSPAAAEVFVRQAAPGLFPVVLHANFSLVGRNRDMRETPAAPGETVILFGTGFGLTVRVAPGRAVVVLPWSVWVEDRRLAQEAVPFVGKAPNFVGLNQVNLVLPEDLERGDHQVFIEIAGARSQPGIRVAVEIPARARR